MNWKKFIARAYILLLITLLLGGLACIYGWHMMLGAILLAVLVVGLAASLNWAIDHFWD